MASVTINGQTVEVEAGSTVLQVAQRLGIEVPTFCYLKRLPPLASCRMCLVEIEGLRRLQPSCATAVTDGMVVRTDTPLIDETRSAMLDMLLANHPLDCPICDKGGECELQDMVMAYGPGKSRFRDPKRVFHSRDIRLSPVVIMNVNRCIQCQRCVRMCEEVVGAVALGTVEKGMDTAVTGFEGSLASCDQCGNCIEVCPVGALMSFPYRYKARPWDLAETDTVCPHCGTGCQLTVGARKGEFMRVRSKEEHGVNRETLCVRGRFGLDFIEGHGRIKRPMIRRDGALVPVSWDEAGDHLRRRLAAVESKAAGGVVSPRLPNEVLYQFQKLMRTVFRTNNIDCSSRWSTPFAALAPLLASYTRAPLEEVIGVDSLLVIGCNVTEENPVTEYLLRDAARRRGARLLMLSTRPSRLDADAEAVVRVPPGREATSLAALVAALAAAAGDKLSGDVLAALGAVTGSATAGNGSNGPDRLAAALNDGGTVTVLVGVDLLRSSEARVALHQLGNLLQLLRRLGKNPALQILFDRANQMGAWDMGALAAALPGPQAVADEKVRATFARTWRAEIPAEPGADLDTMLDLCVAGQMGALYLVGSDPLIAYPDREFVARAFGAADLLIVQESFLTETAALAEVVLPAAGYGEEPGSFTNNEGRIQQVRKFRQPVFEARDNLAIFDFVAALGGQTVQPSTQIEIFDEIARVIPAYQALTWTGLGADGAFTKAGQIPPLGAFHAPPVASHASDGLMLVTGNCLFHNGYLSERSEILNTIANDPYVAMSAEDAVQLGLSDGDQVVVRSTRSELTAQLKIEKSFPKGLVFVPENYRSLRLNSLLRRGEYPCPVEVQKAETAREIEGRNRVWRGA
ncbi:MULTISPECIES: NADH-quinone oxidoreductase subunit NuoG [unclassified Ensifer]|uniref:NADH-quinone oxidoreductase subunit NuoG n=1 Tax=unclassified Ensifer TaxID=2633371 RepID=UPI000813A7BF|nr:MULTISPECIES: NADH-quinone oxidoreductase subunit NuoG [unclassified Ensifer]OCP00645.1 NADH dehydrogenase (quinone) subunit G [Ensifer sp. LC14]OCP07803.1 NADH dehydrogenase (quinone) subunit G [Ensifer sp. LC11]OCP08569.1 NADH dehydrogenase (quinone) subunit G [Ensifer sp. LC13]OCP32139.1 NADH dehydrogenase (quinone) subunit G [Ensifer sp. LC499]